MLRKIRKRITIWRHRNDCVVWQVRENGMVPGQDCPWKAGDTFELRSPSSGNLIGSGKIDAEFAEEFNQGFRWFKGFKSS